jgi:hypothetical protein
MDDAPIPASTKSRSHTAKAQRTASAALSNVTTTASTGMAGNSSGAGQSRPGADRAHHDNSGAVRRASLIKKIYASLESGNLPSAQSIHTATETDNRMDGTPNSTRRTQDVHGTDDQCFVCDLGGHLLLCDFPRCTRAYHQVSVPVIEIAQLLCVSC